MKENGIKSQMVSIYSASLYSCLTQESDEKQEMNYVSMSESELYSTAHPHLNANL